MFNPNFKLEDFKNLNENTIAKHIGIEFVEIGPDYIIAKMPVDHRTMQPFGLLHGGASVVLAETLGSVAAWLTLKDPEKQRCVGIEINANHLKSASAGYVYGRCVPLHTGKRSQVWEIRVTNEANELVCISRITIMVVDVK